MLLLLDFKIERLVGSKGKKGKGKEREEEEYKSVTGRNWNASVARFQDRKVSWGEEGVKGKGKGKGKGERKKEKKNIRVLLEGIGMLLLLDFKIGRLVGRGRKGERGKKEREEEYKSVTGRNWNASVARFSRQKS